MPSLTQNSMTEPPNSNNDGFIPSLYIPSEWNPPIISHGITEVRMMAFATKLKLAAITKNRNNSRSNLRSLQHRLLNTLRNDHRFYVCLTDKNLGPAIMERQYYIQRVYQDHLDNSRTYR
jgi:hypothetical protein